MKMKEAHVVPLSAPAVALLKRLRAEQLALDGDVKAEQLVFSYKGSKPISDMTMLKVLRDMELPGITVHGFRSSFTVWAAERTDFPKEVADKALAHRIPNAVEAAYRRTDFFEKRRSLMDMWRGFSPRRGISDPRRRIEIAVSTDFHRNLRWSGENRVWVDPSRRLYLNQFPKVDAAPPILGEVGPRTEV